MKYALPIWPVIKKAGDALHTFGWSIILWWLAWMGSLLAAIPLVMCISFFVYAVSSILMPYLPVLPFFLMLVLVVLGLYGIAQLALYIPLIAGLRIYDHPAQPLSVAQIRQDITTRHMYRLVGVYLLCGLIVFIGLCLLIIPGIIAAVRLEFAPLMVITRQTSVIQSLKASYRLTQGNFWRLLCMGCIQGLVKWILPLSILLYIATFKDLETAQPNSANL